jgi:hypothetical protein
MTMLSHPHRIHLSGVKTSLGATKHCLKSILLKDNTMDPTAQPQLMTLLWWRFRLSQSVQISMRGFAGIISGTIQLMMTPTT